MENKIDKLEYKNYMNSLFDIYSSLLTEKQCEYFKSYYFDDYSLREIANEYGVSSNAIYDQIKNIEHTLEKFEASLKLLSKSNARMAILEKMDASIDNKEELLKNIKELKQIENN